MSDRGAGNQAHLDHDVQHGPRVGDGHLGLLHARRCDDKVFRKAVGQDAPYPICVQLQGPPSEDTEVRPHAGWTVAHVVSQCQVLTADEVPQSPARLRRPAPNSPDLLDQLPRLGDDVGPREADNAGHLHGVPAGPGNTELQVGGLPPEGHQDQRRSAEGEGHQEGDPEAGQEG